MKGDFSRKTFRREKHYSKVNIQQGRVSVDADWNEQNDIVHHFERTAVRDAFGQSGAPVANPGFKIEPTDSTSYWIRSGRYYVDGILIENEVDVEAAEQPDLRLNNDGTSLALPPTGAFGTYLVYLDVWERHITELDDLNIKESALGEPDTATRNKIVWQVKLFPVYLRSEERGMVVERTTITCQTQFPKWESYKAASTGTLQARTNPKIDDIDECKIPPEAGYRRLENQLYRVEVHKPGGIDNGATFKWQRDNGTIVVQATNITEKTITVTGIGKDKLLGFNSQQWVEIIDDRHELLNLPGTLAKINVISETEFAVVDGTTKGDSLTNDNFPQNYNPKVRRWDSFSRDLGGEMPITIPSTNEGYIPLEDGVEVKFFDGGSSEGGRDEGSIAYRTGDYWLIPARTLNGDIEWLRDDSDLPLAMPADGIEHHYARLALLDYIGDTFKVQDCRQIFPPLTQIEPSQPGPEPPVQVVNWSTWLHGNGVWVEHPETISETRRQWEGAWFRLSDETRQPDNWFHFPLSTSVSDKPQQLLTRVHVLFNSVNISDVSIYDGPNSIGSIKKGGITFASSTILDPSGNTITSCDLDQPHKMEYGLGISVNVEFQQRPFLFSSVGAEFKSA
jgi:Family of unknown function (DUF6519)